MKKLAIPLLIFSAGLFSSPVGNMNAPAILQEGFLIPDVDLYNIRSSYRFSYAQNEKMQFYNYYKRLNYHNLKVSSVFNTGLLTFNYKERLDAYAGIGGGQIFMRFQLPASFYEIKSKGSLSYEGGFKLVFFQMLDRLIFSTDVKVLYYQSGISSFFCNARPIPSGSSKLFYKEWQISPGFAVENDFISPYFGVSFRDARLTIKRFIVEGNNMLKMKYREKSGIFLGAAVTLQSYIFLNLEAHFINEQYGAFSFDVRF